MKPFILEPWSINQTMWDYTLQNQIESVFCQGNGFIGVRAATEEFMPGMKRGTFISGTFNESEGEVTELPNSPDVFGTEIHLDGEPLMLRADNHKNYSFKLNLKNGCITRKFTYITTRKKEIDFSFRRFVSLNEKSLLAQQIKIRVNQPVKLELTAGINGQVTNSGTQHFVAGRRRCQPGKLVQASYTTSQSRVEYAIAGAYTWKGSYAQTSIAMKRRFIGTTFISQINAGETAMFENSTSICTSRDLRYLNKYFSGWEDSKNISLQSAEKGFETLLRENEEQWADFWEHHDVIIDSENQADTTAIRFALYHLKIMSPLHDNRKNIGAKGLSSEAYHGHTFWDTEIFMLTPWLYTLPEAAKSLIMYRWLSLPKAREKALEYGCKGALFPWESAWIDSGETTPLEGEPDVVTGEPIPIRTGVQEIHVNADVAFGVFLYWQATDDIEFMLKYGCEILLETALYWATRASWNQKKQQYDIIGVIGPDEYSENVTNNAYTNYMAGWNIATALLWAEKLKKEHVKEYEIIKAKTEFFNNIELVTNVAEKLYLPQPDSNGIIPQDDKFLSLKDIDISTYKNGERKILSDYNVEQLSEYQVTKQGDLVVLFSLFPHLFSKEIIRKNLDYYEKRCVHDSSLSYNTHSIVAAMLGDNEQSYKWFLKAAEVDLKADNSQLGIHAAAMGGIWQCAIHGYAGIRAEGGKLYVSPNLPNNWKSISFNFVWKGETLKFEITHNEIFIHKATVTPLEIIIYESSNLLENELRIKI